MTGGSRARGLPRATDTVTPTLGGMDTITVGRSTEIADAIAALAGGTGVLLVGEAGVGKSHLLTAVLAGCADHVVRVDIRGHASSRDVPFGAVAHLLDQDDAPHRALLLASLRAAVLAMGDGRHPVLAIDDIDQLDDDTLSLAVSLAATGDATVVATCRTQAAPDPRLVGLWKDGLVVRRTVGPLDRTASDELAATLLGGAVSRSLADRLWQAARGNALYVRELLLAGMAEGVVLDNGRYWELDGPLTIGSNVSDLVAHRLSGLEPAATDVLAIVAVAEPARSDVLAELVPSDALALLERRRLIDSRSVGARTEVVTSHPLVGEVVRAGLGHYQRRRILERLVTTDAHRTDPGEALRVATWLLEIGQPPDADLAVAAARTALARFDHDTASRLADTVHPPSIDALVVRARARTGVGEVDAAVEDLERAIEQAGGDVERTRATSALIEVLGLAGGDLTRANSRLASAIEATDDASLRRELRWRSLVVAGLGGRFADALTIADELADTDVDHAVQAHGLMVLTLAQAMTGRLDDVEDRLDRATDLADELRLVEPYLREQVGLNRALVLQASARLVESMQWIDTVLADAGGRRHVGPWLFVGAVAEMLVGDLDRASTRTAEAYSLLVDSDPLGMRAMAASLAAAVAGTMGRSVDQWSAAAQQVGRADEVRASVWLSMGQAWSLARSGDTDAGARLARDAAREAIAGEHVVWGAIVMHAAVRMGRPAMASEYLAGLDAGPLVDLLADHAIAAASQDIDHLAIVGMRLEDHGALAIAVDAWAAVAGLAGPESASGARAAVRALQLAERCTGSVSWLARDLESPVTARQVEVGRLAAAGLESRAIADRLDIATKTADNHLQRLYSRLELAGRHDLGLVFPS